MENATGITMAEVVPEDNLLVIEELLTNLNEAIEQEQEERVENLIKEWEDKMYQAKCCEATNSVKYERIDYSNTVLHYAVLFGNNSIVKHILKTNRISPEERNQSGQTVLHLMNSETCEKSSCLVMDHTCLEELLGSDSLKQEALDAQDNKGHTALHYAVERKCAYCVQRLIRAGASFNIKSNSKSLPFVTPSVFNEFPWAGDFLINKMDKGIQQEKGNGQHSAGDQLMSHEKSRFQISVDFSCIVPISTVGCNENNKEPQKEMEFLETILSANGADHEKILTHPLISSFVFMKWEKMKRLFELSLILHVILAVIYTKYILTVFKDNCPFKPFQNMTQVVKKCDEGWGSAEYSISLLVVTFILGLLEGIKFFQNPQMYLYLWSNYFQMSMITLMYLTVYPVKWNSHGSVHIWQYPVSAYGVFNVWATIMINMGRFPKLGIYVEMFGKVLRNFGFFLLAYIFLILAFSISFCVIFPDYPPFKTIPRAILKVITMMSGEVDYGDFFYGHPNEKDSKPLESRLLTMPIDHLLHPDTGHIVYGAFVILITIVLTNLLIGLAVNDIKGLQQNAGFMKTTREIGNFAYLESLIFWSRIPNVRCVRWLRKFISVGRSDETQSNPASDETDNRDGSKSRFSLKWITSHVHRFYSSLISLKNRCMYLHRGFDQKQREINKTSFSKYTFEISHEDCKFPRSFPKDALLKGVEITNKENGASSHCPTCYCSIPNYESYTTL